MAIICETAENDYVAIPVRDQYEEKAQRAELRRFELLQKYLSFGRWEIKDTTMIQLMLMHKVTFSDEDTMLILHLDREDPNHVRLYCGLFHLVKYTALTLVREVPVNLLLEMPLTDIRRLVYHIANRYDSLFYVPVKDDVAGSSLALKFLWRDRYNCCWPIVCMLEREYQKGREELREEDHEEEQDVR